MRSIHIGRTEICTDGLKVWVNRPEGCIARLCRVSMEIFPATQGFDLPLAFEFTQKGTWERFREAVAHHHGVKIPADFIPDWATPVIQRQV